MRWRRVAVLSLLVSTAFVGLGALVIEQVPPMGFLFVAAGTFTLLVLAFNFLQRTRLVVERGTLLCSYAPLPWSASERVPLDDLEQVAVAGEIRGSSEAYAVELTCDDGRSIRLLGAIPSQEEAHALAKVVWSVVEHFRT